MSNSDNANKEFCCEYEFDGSRWGVNIFASTREEAEMKLKAIGKTGIVLGVCGGKIPADGICPECKRPIEE